MLTTNEILSRMFFDARSQNGWSDAPIGDELIRSAYEIAKWGPTSMNTQPMRLLLLRSADAKLRLKPALAPGNVDKTMSAPVIAIIAHDSEFYSYLPQTFPHNPDAAARFASNPEVSQATALRNGTLQAAYFMLALRAVGLDVGPMSGFDAGKVDAEFFGGTTWRANFLCGIGHGDPAKIFDRLPRLDFEVVAASL